MSENVIRQACSALPLVGEPGKDIRTQTQELGARMVAELQLDASVFGVKVQRLVVVEARVRRTVSESLWIVWIVCFVGTRAMLGHGVV